MNYRLVLLNHDLDIIESAIGVSLRYMGPEDILNTALENFSDVQMEEYLILMSYAAGRRIGESMYRNDILTKMTNITLHTKIKCVLMVCERSLRE
jgi:hypothetical protein